MKKKPESSNKEGKKGKTIIISADLTIDDIDRIKTAFVKGELKDLGVISIQVESAEERDIAKDKWQRGERKKKTTNADKDMSPP